MANRIVSAAVGCMVMGVVLCARAYDWPSVGCDPSRADGGSFSKGASAVSPCGVDCSNSVFRGESFAMFRSRGDLSEGGIMRISFDAEWRDVTPDEPSYSCAGTVVLVEYVDAGGRKVHPKNVNMGFGTRRRGSYELEFPVAKGAKDFWAYFGVRWARGHARFTNIRIRLDRPDARSLRSGAVAGAASAEIIDDSNVGARLSAESSSSKSFLMETTPPPKWKAPHIPGGRPFAFFRVDSPRRTFDRYPPHPSQLQDTFSIAATPGETADLFFGVYAEKESALSIAVDGFAGPGGAVVRPELFRARNWMRADGKLGAYIQIPEVLFPVEAAQAMKPGTTALLMAQFRVSDGAKPGVYRGKVQAKSAAGAVHSADVELTVLPFRLRRPPPDMHEMIIHGGPYSPDGPPDRLVELFKWLKGRGFESALVPCQYSPGMLELEKDAQGHIAIKSFKKLDDALAAYRAAGMKGTLFVHFSDKLEVAVAKALGVPFPDGMGEQTNMVPEMSTPWFKAAAVEALVAVRRRCGDVPLAVLGVDEPNVAARVPRAVWERERIDEAGIMSAIYCSADAWSNVRTKIAISSSAPGTKGCQMLDRETAALGGRLYLYSLEGSYGYAFGGAHGSWGGLMPSRQTVGWSEFLTPGSRGHTVWLFATPSAGGVSETDEMAPKGWATLTRYDKKGRLLSTLQLEGDLLGVADYAYLHTLSELLKERKSHPRRDDIAAEFAALAREIRANWHPYCLDSADAEVPSADGSLRSFLNADADRARAKVTDWILELLHAK
ncbi:MAG: hypothetical protein IJG13_20550 [Kiritimatiellae bacterium]|nr:hypothetical protein [Kiritimatiellia bacterium]